jgi:HAD superfamily hydrolase (TIGR01509 family)
MDFKNAIFDMDGTLVNSLTFWSSYWSRLGEVYFNDKNFKPTKEEDVMSRTSLVKDAMKVIHENYHIGKDAKELYEFADDYMRWYYLNVVTLKEGAVEYLDYLYKKGVKLAIASGTEPKNIKLVLERFNLTKYFDVIVSCLDVNKGKEEPDVYYLTLEKLGATPKDTILFEDSLLAVQTATKIGMKCVGIYDKNNFGFEEMEKICIEVVKEDETFLKFL